MPIHEGFTIPRITVERFAANRWNMNLSAQDMADLLGISQRTVLRIEAGYYGKHVPRRFAIACHGLYLMYPLAAMRPRSLRR